MLGLTCVLARGPAAAGAGKALEGVINLNTAPPETLSLLPGIGPSKVDLILAYRRRRPFRTVDELVRVKGIGRRMVRALRAHLAISGPTTATPLGARPPVVPQQQAPPPRPPPPRAMAAAHGVPGAGHASRPPARPGARVAGSASVPLAARAYCLRPP